MDHSVPMDFVCTTLAFIDGLGAPEMVLVFILVLVLFGGNKLPEFARGLGKTMREFKKAATGVEEEFRRALEEDERKQNQLKLAESPTPVIPEPAPAPYDPHAPDTTVDHYDHDYHSGENPTDESTSAATPATPMGEKTSPDTPVADEGGPVAPSIGEENTIHEPKNTAATDGPATPALGESPAATPETAATPATKTPPAGEHAIHP